MMRTDYCGALRVEDAGRQVTVCGWVARRREHGEHLAFIDLRDHTGIVQCVVDGAHDLRSIRIATKIGEQFERADVDPLNGEKVVVYGIRRASRRPVRHLR